MMDRDYEFLNAISCEERSDLSKAVRDLVTRGRVLLAVEKYRKGEASLGKAAQVASLPVGQMMTLLGEFAVRSPGCPYRSGKVLLSVPKLRVHETLVAHL
jgi:hypothetical protein